MLRYLGEVVNYLHGNNIIAIAFKIVLAMIAGGILGLEREFKNRPAGLRTFMLVCIGSTLVMLTNQYVCETYSHLNIDPTRMGAQVISGIGFLGVGTIIVTRRNHVKGLTTAAGLWASACIGLAIGIGFYSGAIIACIGVLLTMRGMNKIDTIIWNKREDIEVYVEFESITNIPSFVLFLKENNFDVDDLLIDKKQISKGENIAMIVTLKSQVNMSYPSIIQLISQSEGVQYVEEV